MCWRRGIPGLRERDWAGLLYWSQHWQENFPQMVGRDFFFLIKKNGFVCLIPVFIVLGGGQFSYEADLIGHFAGRGAG